MALRPEGHGDSQDGLPDEWSIQFHHIYVPNGLRLPFFRILMPTLLPYLHLPILKQHARSGFSFYRGREEAVHYDRQQRLIVGCSCGRESTEAA